MRIRRLNADASIELVQQRRSVGEQRSRGTWAKNVSEKCLG